MPEQKLEFSVDINSRVWAGIIAPIYLIASATLAQAHVTAEPLVGRSVKGSDVRVRIEAYGDTEREMLDITTTTLGDAERESEGS
jgi:hypothetical protein